MTAPRLWSWWLLLLRALVIAAVSAAGWLWDVALRTLTHHPAHALRWW